MRGGTPFERRGGFAEEGAHFSRGAGCFCEEGVHFLRGGTLFERGYTFREGVHFLRGGTLFERRGGSYHLTCMFYIGIKPSEVF